MAKSTVKKTLNTHDRIVREIVRQLEKEDYKVRADVRGRERPRPIGRNKLRPDIEATKNGRRQIIEVETPTSLSRDKDQLKTFARHAGQKKNTTFKIVVTKPRKK